MSRERLAAATESRSGFEVATIFAAPAASTPDVAAMAAAPSAVAVAGRLSVNRTHWRPVMASLVRMVRRVRLLLVTLWLSLLFASTILLLSMLLIPGRQV
jgi:hypothetical protein